GRAPAGALPDRPRQSGIEGGAIDRIEELAEGPRATGREEPRLVELVVVEQPRQLRAVGDAIEDVRGGAVGLGPAGHDQLLLAQRPELLQMGGPERQAARAVVPLAGGADVV